MTNPDREDRIPFTELTVADLDELHNELDRYAEVVHALNTSNIQLARDLAARNAQLGRYLTLLQLMQECLQQVREYEKKLWDDDSNQTVPISAVSHAVANNLRHILGDYPAAAGDRTEGHIYLSTGCLHDNHEYCQSMTGIQGAKRGGRCKQCDAQCICTCHTEEPECSASVSGDCLRESQSETACDTDDGECVHGDQPGRSDVGTEFVRQVDTPDEAGIAAFEMDLDEEHIEEDTLPQWLYQRYACTGQPSGRVAWDDLNDNDRSYWEHQARATQRAVTRGGFRAQEAE